MEDNQGDKVTLIIVLGLLLHFIHFIITNY